MLFRSWLVRNKPIIATATALLPLLLFISVIIVIIVIIVILLIDWKEHGICSPTVCLSNSYPATWQLCKLERVAFLFVSKL